MYMLSLSTTLEGPSLQSNGITPVVHHDDHGGGTLKIDIAAFLPTVDAPREAQFAVALFDRPSRHIAPS